MNAKQMFEELGYEQSEIKLYSERYGIHEVYRKYYNDGNNEFIRFVVFKLKENKYKVFERELYKFVGLLNGDNPMEVSVLLEKAIHTRMKELGWLDE